MSVTVTLTKDQMDTITAALDHSHKGYCDDETHMAKAFKLSETIENRGLPMFGAEDLPKLIDMLVFLSQPHRCKEYGDFNYGELWFKVIVRHPWVADFANHNTILEASKHTKTLSALGGYGNMRDMSYTQLRLDWVHYALVEELMAHPKMGDL